MPNPLGKGLPMTAELAECEKCGHTYSDHVKLPVGHTCTAHDKKFLPGSTTIVDVPFPCLYYRLSRTARLAGATMVDGVPTIHIPFEGGGPVGVAQG